MLYLTKASDHRKFNKLVAKEISETFHQIPSDFFVRVGVGSNGEFITHPYTVKLPPPFANHSAIKLRQSK